MCFSVPQRNSLPQHTPIPGSSSIAVLVSSTLWVDGVLLPINGVDERHRTHRSDQAGMEPCTYNTWGQACDVHAGQNSWASSDNMEVGLKDRHGDTNRTGMNISMLPSKGVPVRQSGVFSVGLLSLA